MQLSTFGFWVTLQQQEFGDLEHIRFDKENGHQENALQLQIFMAFFEKGKHRSKDDKARKNEEKEEVCPHFRDLASKEGL